MFLLVVDAEPQAGLDIKPLASSDDLLGFKVKALANSGRVFLLQSPFFDDVR